MNFAVKQIDQDAQLAADKVNRQAWRAKLEAEDAAIARGEAIHKAQSDEARQCEEAASAARTRRATRLEAQLSGGSDIVPLHAVDEDHDARLRKTQSRLADTALALELLRKKRHEVAAGLARAENAVHIAAHAILKSELDDQAAEINRHLDAVTKLGAALMQTLGNDFHYRQDELYRPLPPEIAAVLERLPKRDLRDVPINEIRYGQASGPPLWMQRLDQLLADETAP